MLDGQNEEEGADQDEGISRDTVRKTQFWLNGADVTFVVAVRQYMQEDAHSSWKCRIILRISSPSACLDIVDPSSFSSSLQRQ